MDDSSDPLNQFFTPKEASDPEILYHTLSVPKSAAPEQIRISYRKLALKHHPDKHSSTSDSEKEAASKTFQKIGFAYAVLSDEKRRKRYDATGHTAENAFTDAEDVGWDAYFESLFQRLDRKMLDDDKVKYQGSQDEIDDVVEGYEASGGSLPDILERVLHATHDDEPRLLIIINRLIEEGKLKSTKKWKSTSTDTKAKAKRSKAAEKQAKEAEQSAKELGVWDEFYGSGKKGKRKGQDEDAGGEGGLQALILKRQKERTGMFDALAEKYGAIEQDEREKKRAKGRGKGKKGKNEDSEPPAPMTDAEFEAMQAKMFGPK